MNAIKIIMLTAVISLTMVACADKNEDKIIEVDKNERLIERDQDKTEIDVKADDGKLDVGVKNDKNKVDVEIGKDEK